MKKSREENAIPSNPVARLSPEERLDLIGKLWDSLDDGDLRLTPAQQEELDHRLLAQEGDPSTPWPQLREELRRRAP